jgi:hypothetical protein
MDDRERWGNKAEAEADGVFQTPWSCPACGGEGFEVKPVARLAWAGRLATMTTSPEPLTTRVVTAVLEAFNDPGTRCLIGGTHGDHRVHHSRPVGRSDR